jgi:hypothetical protein
MGATRKKQNARDQVPRSYKSICKMIYIICRDSSVGILTTLRTGRPKIRGSISVRERDILFFTAYEQTFGDHPTTYPVGSAGSFPGLKRPKRRAVRSTPSSTEVKNEWSYTSTPPHAFMTRCLIRIALTLSLTSGKIIHSREVLLKNLYRKYV